MHKNKAISKTLIIALMACLCFANIQVLAEENSESKVILIDPGHGGIDGGAQSKDKTLEKDINLAISLKLKENLEERGYKVEMTRCEDAGLYEKGQTVREKKREDLSNRVKRKDETKCDVFISIHQNMFPQSKCKGAQVWHSCNTYSKALADALQNSFKENIDPNNHRLAKAACEEYRILRDNYKGASVIVECGFLSNDEELQLLKNDEYQNKLADAIAKGIDSYMATNPTPFEEQSAS